MPKFNLEQMVRSIVQDELQKSFGFENEETDPATSSDDIQLSPLSKSPVGKRGRAKNFGRGRVTKPTDGRLKINKK